MTEQQNTLIRLIKSALTGEPYALPQDFDLAEAFQIANATAWMLWYITARCFAA